MNRNAIKDLATELRIKSLHATALSQQRVSSLVDRIAANIGVTLSPRPDPVVAQPDAAETAAVVAPVVAAMEMVIGAHPGFCPQWDPAFDKIFATLVDAGWQPTKMDATDRFAAPDAIRRIADDKSHLLRPGTPVWTAAFASLLPYLLTIHYRVPNDHPGSRFAMLSEEKTGAAALIALKLDNGPKTTLTLTVDFGTCDRRILRSALEDAEFTRSFARSTTRVNNERLSIDAETSRVSRDGLAVMLKADIWPTAITDDLRALGLPPSIGALEAQLEEAMY